MPGNARRYGRTEKFRTPNSEFIIELSGSETMTIQDVIERVDELAPNQYTEEQKKRWL